MAIVHEHLSARGGAENLIEWFAEGLLKKGHNVSLFVNDATPEQVRKFDVRIVPITNHAEKWIKTLKILRRELSRFDVINTHNFPSTTLVYLTKRFFNLSVPVVWYCHEPKETYYGKSIDEFVSVRLKKLKMWWNPAVFMERLTVWLDRKAVRNSDLVVSNSKRTAEFVKIIYGVDSQVIYPGVPDVNNILPRRKRKRMVLTVSRLFPVKNLDAVLKTAEKIKDALFVIVGSGPEESKLRNLKLPNVEFKGFVSRESLDALYREAMVVLYVPFEEPFGLVPVEAMRFATPPVFSLTGGAAEVIEDGVNGFKVAPDDIEGIIGKVKLLLNREEVWNLVSEGARKSFEENFSIEVFTSRMIELFSKVSEQSAFLV